ncbi:MAG TPA: Arm DNA-binding domain-containing protein [Thiobacillus sp.]|nr:Arm DNA-binding domain-containing protein [Thiobacillus sp.]HQT69544.1 Arm DNA-binding domain-containing protein [Thiobacillus sp.]
MPLSDPAIKKAKSEATSYKLTDEKWLFLLVNAAGKYWRLAYRFGGKQKWTSLACNRLPAH